MLTVNYKTFSAVNVGLNTDFMFLGCCVWQTNRLRSGSRIGGEVDKDGKWGTC